MRRPLIRRVLLSFLMFLFMCQPLLSQEASKALTSATSPTVPALNEFHKVIFKIWHTAWPKKDYDMLAALLPEIKKGAAAVAGAELPGILREKKTAWTSGIEKLQEIVSKYETAVETHQGHLLLDAAEDLHSQFESLVRVIRPPLKELEDFHAVLYRVVHYYVPQDSLEEIRASIGALQQKMAALNKATLPPRFKRKEESFTLARGQLDRSVAELAAVAGSKESGEIKAAVEATHESYKAVAKIFE